MDQLGVHRSIMDSQRNLVLSALLTERGTAAHNCRPERESVHTRAEQGQEEAKMRAEVLMLRAANSLLLSQNELLEAEMLHLNARIQQRGSLGYKDSADWAGCWE